VKVNFGKYSVGLTNSKRLKSYLEKLVRSQVYKWHYGLGASMGTH